MFLYHVWTVGRHLSGSSSCSALRQKCVYTALSHVPFWIKEGEITSHCQYMYIFFAFFSSNFPYYFYQLCSILSCILTKQERKARRAHHLRYCFPLHFLIHFLMETGSWGLLAWNSHCLHCCSMCSSNKWWYSKSWRWSTSINALSLE